MNLRFINHLNLIEINIVMPSIPQSFYGIIEGLVYYSESDNGYAVQALESTSLQQVPSEIAGKHDVDIAVIKTVDADLFFQHIINAADPNDAVLVANAKKTAALHQFLKDNLSDITVYRVESGVRIPIYIVGILQEHFLIAITTTSVET